MSDGITGRRVSGKTILVTAAAAGIGRASALMLARQGAERRADQATASVRELTAPTSSGSGTARSPFGEFAANMRASSQRWLSAGWRLP